MELYREWVPSNLFRTGNVVPVAAFEQILARRDPGYWSVYAINATDAQLIRAAGSSAGLSRFPVWADRVTLDIDNPDDINQCLEKLDQLGLAYEVWDSGRGYHIEIPHDPIYDNRLPYSHKVWVEALGLPVDYSLYQHGRIIRCPGTVNTKTGRRKQFLEKVDGMKAEIELRTPPAFDFKPDGGLKTISTVLNHFQRLAIAEPLPGNRHTQIWSAARSACDAGLSFSATEEILQEVNRSWQSPKEPEEVTRAIQQAYSGK